MSTKLAHIVFFKLHDASSAKVKELVEACHRYLKNHPGVIHFSAGTRNPHLDRPVNDKDYDVALHVIFDSRDAHDAYQIAASHLKFIEEQKANWKQVRVFDSDLHPSGE